MEMWLCDHERYTMAYFIGGIDQPVFTVDPIGFTNQLVIQWPNTQIRSVSDPRSDTLMEWEISIGNLLLGFLFIDRQRIMLEGSIEDAAIFVVWYRSIVPYEYRLFLGDDSFSDERTIELINKTTANDILSVF